LRSLQSRIREKFGVSIAETGAQDSWQTAELTVACVASDANHARQTLEKIADFIEEYTCLSRLSRPRANWSISSESVAASTTGSARFHRRDTEAQRRVEGEREKRVKRRDAKGKERAEGTNIFSFPLCDTLS